MPVEIDDTVWKRLKEPTYWHLATINADGTPQNSPVWVDLRDDGTIVVNTATRHLKYKNMRSNPAVALSNAATDNPFDHIQIRGKVVDVREGDVGESDCDAMARKYTGNDYKFRAPGEKRVTFVIEPTFVRHFVP
jgi:PPOX class probable F420-dependent enzyme